MTQRVPATRARIKREIEALRECGVEIDYDALNGAVERVRDEWIPGHRLTLGEVIHAINKDPAR